MQLLYKATTKDGRVVKGIIEAKDQSEAATFLRTKELLPIHITPKQDVSLRRFLPFLKKSNYSDLIFFTRQIASMLSAGLTLMQALSILHAQSAGKPVIESTISGIISDIEEGKSFSFAITKYPDMFSPIYISLIKAAESSGLLDKVMDRLASTLEKQARLRNTIKAALMYPIIVIVGMIGVMFVMMIFVVPQLDSLYQGLGVPLPLPTQIVIFISRFFVVFWPLMLGLMAIGIFLFKRWHSTQSGRLVIDDVMLRLPIIGKLSRELALAEISRTTGMLVGSGTLVVEAFRQTADVTGNVLYKNAIVGVARRVEKGVTVGDAMNAYDLFPPILVQMVKIGEQTGKLDESLTKVSEYFEGEVDQSIKTLTTALEPAIMVVLGVGVAFLIISIITPIYNLTSAIK